MVVAVLPDAVFEKTDEARQRAPVIERVGVVDVAAFTRGRVVVLVHVAVLQQLPKQQLLRRRHKALAGNRHLLDVLVRRMGQAFPHQKVHRAPRATPPIGLIAIRRIVVGDARNTKSAPEPWAWWRWVRGRRRLWLRHLMRGLASNTANGSAFCGVCLRDVFQEPAVPVHAMAVGLASEDERLAGGVGTARSTARGGGRVAWPGSCLRCRLPCIDARHHIARATYEQNDHIGG